MKQRLGIFLILFAMLLGVAACSSDASEDRASDEASTVTADQEETITADDTSADLTEDLSNQSESADPVPDADTDDREALDSALLEYFQTDYFSSETRARANFFLASEYERPEDIDLLQLFYCGLSGEEQTVSEDERLKVYDALYPQELDITKYPTEAIDAVLLQYTGLTLDETNRVNLSGFAYLEDYDAYYLLHGDTLELTTVTITAGYWDDAGSIVLEYDLPSMGSIRLPSGTVILTPTEDGQYFIVSNQYSS